MLLRAKKEYGVDLSLSWMIGDSRTDIEAGKGVSCWTAFVGFGGPETAADIYAPSLCEIVDKIELHKEFNLASRPKPHML
jgi:histidinol phosphatase-like enzyme